MNLQWFLQENVLRGISYVKGFLAEDEIVMREGIKNNIDWQGKALNLLVTRATGSSPIRSSRRRDRIF